MATKANKKNDTKKRTFNVSQMIRDAKEGKIAESTFKGNLTKHYREVGKDDTWITRRVKSLAREAKPKSKSKRK
jgi:hypothetical protein